MGAAVHAGVAADLEDEEGGGAEGEAGHGADGLADLEGDLVLEELGVLEGFLVEEEDVAEAGEGEVVDEAKDPEKVSLPPILKKIVKKEKKMVESLPGGEEQGDELAEDVVPRPDALVGRARGFQVHEVRGRLVFPAPTAAVAAEDVLCGIL